MPFTEQIKLWLNKIRQFKLQEDRAILLSCIGIALFFWILVKLSQEYTSQKFVVFSYETLDGLALANLPPDDVRATLKGTGWNLLLEYLGGSSIPVHFNIEDLGPFGLNRAQLRGEILSALATKELDIVEINYDEIILNAENKITKRLPIKHQIALSFAPEYHLSSPIVLEPDSVELTGAASVIAPLKYWTTDSLSFVELGNTVSEMVQLKSASPEINLNITETKLTIPIEAYTEKSLFIPVNVINAPSDSLKVFPDKIKISFAVGLSRYDSINYTDFKLVADLKTSSLGKGKNTAPVNLVLVPPSVKNVLLSRNSVEFFVLKPKELSKEN